MNEMLTAKDVQKLLQVDRSTVYRMAEAGRLPAIKIGKQWRFPAEKIQDWLAGQLNSQYALPIRTTTNRSDQPQPVQGENDELAELLPIECVQLIQDSHAELLGIMLLITDMTGKPITTPSNPCGLFSAVNWSPDAIQRCIQSWHDLGRALNIGPAFHTSQLGLLCARGLIRIGSELKGMVVAGCVAPDEWPPPEDEIQAIAANFDIAPTLLKPRMHEVFNLSNAQKASVLLTVQKVADIVAHIVQERRVLVERLDAISTLARL